MFIGAINSTLRKFLASEHRAFLGAHVVVGCSGNFTSEAVLTQFANPSEIHSNDVSFYSSLLGSFLLNRSLDFEIVDDDYAWLADWMDKPERRVAAIMVLLDMLDFEKRNNHHSRRMWDVYRSGFGDLVGETAAKVLSTPVRITSYFAGDVLEHFERFHDDADAIFCCYAPPNRGGYERLYKRLDQIVRWAAPTYPMLDDERREKILSWIEQRRYLWYDDRVLEGRQPVLVQRTGRNRTVYLYSNVIENPAYFAEMDRGLCQNCPWPLPRLN